jgi:hypothetical protein
MRRRLLISQLFFLFMINSFVLSEILSKENENENDLPMARLMPIASEYPLILSDQNRFALLESPEIVVENQNSIQFNLKSHTFPWIVLIGFAFAGLGWALYIAWKQNRPRLVVKKEELTFSQKLELTFSDIQKNRLIENHHVQILYPKLEELMHEFLSMQDKIMTSREYEKTLDHATRFSLNEKEKIVYYLRTFDEVRFACKEPSIEESRQTANDIYHLLRSQLSSQ